MNELGNNIPQVCLVTSAEITKMMVETSKNYNRERENYNREEV